MLSKEERAAMRERCESGAECKTTADAIAETLALLDALDEMERENARMQSRIKELNEHIGRTQYGSDYWKAWAKALERAQHETSTCDTCLHVHKDFYEGPCKTCAKEKNWKFDQERFKG